MKKFTFYRSAIVGETYEIVAENEDAARAQLDNPPNPVATDWLDWYTDDFQLEDVAVLDELAEIAQKHNMGY